MRPHKIKTILIGDYNTGKSTLCERFLLGEEDFSRRCPPEPTVGVDFGTREVHAPSYGPIRFHLWDTSGAEKFNAPSMTQVYYRHTEGVLLVFDVSCRSSFENISEVWLRRVRSARDLSPEYRCILIGNKSDLSQQRAVGTEEAVALAKHLDMGYVELSSLASSAEEILQPFLMLAIQVIDQRELAGVVAEDRDVIHLGEDHVERWRCCSQST
jgi:small GTP-binding protein